jgi:hypothetical protein
MRNFILLISSLLASCSDGQDTLEKRPELSSEMCGVGAMHILDVPKGTVSFAVSRKKPAESDIYINSNFFDHRGPIGELIVSKKRLSSRVRGGGYFFVTGGVPGVSAYAPPKNPEHSTQSILVAIDNGKVNKPMLRRAHARESTYRSLIGVDSSNNLTIIVSGRGCTFTISDIVDAAKRRGVREAILPDAGSSVDYKLSDGNSEVSMKAVPGLMKSAMKIEEPKSYITGKILEQ